MNGILKVLSDQQSKFTLLSLNVECLSAKFDKLVAFISILTDNKIQFDAINLQETWLPDADKTNYSLFELPGYKLIPQGYRCGRKGGLITYLREHYTYTIRNDYKNSNHWEGLFIDITSESLTKKLTLGNIYRPPRDNYSNHSIDNFLLPIAKK